MCPGKYILVSHVDKRPDFVQRLEMSNDSRIMTVCSRQTRMIELETVGQHDIGQACWTTVFVNTLHYSALAMGPSNGEFWAILEKPADFVVKDFEEPAVFGFPRTQAELPRRHPALSEPDGQFRSGLVGILVPAPAPNGGYDIPPVGAQVGWFEIKHPGI
ncbi:hypothetical protein BD779DRAFT_1513434 [Infundibulicybe gibba]|nr:hypothetical protein BD779DRAFT_1513434 [Infundibulicybe gibba]